MSNKIITRFDSSEFWIDGKGNKLEIKKMSVQHLMNIVKMFIEKPFSIQEMLIKDVGQIWGIDNKASIRNITSMNLGETMDYFYSSELFTALEKTLIENGVNFEQFLKNIQ